jgi:chaperonin cofactor prefoldin
MKTPRTKLARAKLRARRTRLDVKITRDKKQIKSLERKLRKKQALLERRLNARAKLRSS